jgi:CheY-like chemotaxis protein
MEVEKTIFVVDDDEDDRMLISESLRALPEIVNIIEVQSGTDMYELLCQEKHEGGFRLILLDMNMPRMNGLELLQRLRDNPKWRSVPVIMLSTSSNPALIKEAYQLGVNVFVVKPVTIAEFEGMTKMINDCFIHNFVSNNLYSAGKKPGWRNVMFIEDNDDHWELMRFSLQQSAPEMRITRISEKGDVINVLQSQYRLTNSLPELIFLDLYMPDREDGLNLLESIRMFSRKHNLITILVVAFSYSGDRRDIEAALAGQANAYLIKPTDITSFPTYLNSLCSVWANAVSLPQ